MSVSVLVPRSPGSCDHRDAAWTWLERRWGALHPTWEVVEGNADPERWCKAEAVANALAGAAGDTLVICDGDLICDPVALARAVTAVEVGAPWAIPYHVVHRLTPSATDDLLRRDPAEPVDTAWTRRNLTRQAYSSRPGGGVLVVTRRAYETAGGFDPRFVGWGGEDTSLGFALRTLAGPFTRIRGELVHLWHSPQARRQRPDRLALERRYKRANDDPAAMAALVAEHQEAHA